MAPTATLAAVTAFAASLVSVMTWSASLPVVTARSASFVSRTAPAWISVEPIALTATFAWVTASSASLRVVTMPSTMPSATTGVGPNGPTVPDGVEAVPEVLRATRRTYTGLSQGTTTVAPCAVSMVP
jgi:hypothetical protein